MVYGYEEESLFLGQTPSDLTDNVNTTSSIHSFTVDDNIINHIITHQTGSLQKALTELVMNAIDANANKITIDFDKTSFKITDNGHGFKDKGEIINFFGRFGTPHQKGDATFGRFRIGRGQIMAFAKCTWRSSTYAMETDIKNKGLTYTLYEDLEYVEGCIVKGELYFTNKWDEDYRPNEFWQLIRNVEFLDIDITMNGKCAASRYSNTEWEIDHELFYFKPSKEDYINSPLRVYNKGVFVCEYPRKNVGRSGYLISKETLEVNFARNAILENECKVWREIVSVLRDSVVKRRNFVKPVPIEDRTVEYSMFKSGKTPLLEFIQLRLLENVNGDVFSFNSLDKSKIDITIAEYSNISWAEHLSAQATCFVFKSNAATEFNPDWRHDRDINPVLELIELVIAKAREEIKNIRTITAEWGKLDEIIKWASNSTFYKNPIGLEKKYPSEKKPYSLTSLTPEELVFFKEISRANSEIRSIAFSMLKAKGKVQNINAFKARKLSLGDSLNTARGWTDGSVYISLDIGFFRRAIKQDDSGIFKMILVLAHEYIHIDGDIKTHKHDSDFYEIYHDMLQFSHDSLYDVAYRTSKRITNKLVKNGLKIRATMSKRYSKEC